MSVISGTGARSSILGVGIGNYRINVLNYKSYYEQFGLYFYSETMLPHNFFLHTWAETGILGVTSLLIAILTTIKDLIKECRKSASSKLINYLAVIMFFNILMNLTMNGFQKDYFWVFLALVVSGLINNKNEDLMNGRDTNPTRFFVLDINSF